MSRLAVFGYASLVDRDSAAETLGRPVGACPLATLAGWSRGWRLLRDNLRSEKTFALADGTVPPFVLGLSVEPSGDAEPPNGVLIEVSESELERLDLREMRYRRVDVSDSIEGDAAAGFDAVVTYRARPENLALEPPPGAVILSSYADAVEASFAALGDSERSRYLETTGPPPVDVVEAKLTRDRIPPGNPRRW